MKKAILFVLIISAANANGQKLKDLLYSGKLKMDSTGVVRSTDDLKSKTDTSQKKAEPQKAKLNSRVAPDSSLNKADNTSTQAITAVSTDETTSTASVTSTSTTPVKSNNKIWKEYTDSKANNLKDLFSAKKVKKETYFFTVEYEIGTDGVTNINNVTVTPENDFLAASVKQLIESSPPQLSPVLNSAGQPVKVKRRHNFSYTKE
jgi:hypothetical protein